MIQQESYLKVAGIIGNLQITFLLNHNSAPPYFAFSIISTTRQHLSLDRKKAQISDEDLYLILQAGTYAASGHGLQPCTIVVIQDTDTLARLSALNAKIMGTTSAPMYGAPTVLLVLADMEKSPNAWSDGCLILGNLMNAAASLHQIGRAHV